MLVEKIQTEFDLYKYGRKSDIRSTPSSQDYSRSNKNNSREKSTNKSGGQKGPNGSTLKMSNAPDEIKEYKLEVCENCGNRFENETEFALEKRRQEIEIPPIRSNYVEHQSFSFLSANRGQKNNLDLPPRLKANIQYGPNIQAQVGYMSAYQYLPSNRIMSCFQDFISFSMSEGTI